MGGSKPNRPLLSDGFSTNLVSDGLGHYIGDQYGGSGKTWIVTNGVWAASGGKMTCSNVGGNTGRVIIDVGVKDYVIETTLYAAGNIFGFILRYVDENNFIRAYIDYPNVKIITMVGGVETTLLNQAIAYVDAQQLRFTVNDDKIDAWYGGTLAGTGGNGGTVGTQQTITDAALLTSTKVGLISSNIGNSFDNFSVWSITVWNRIHRPGGVLFTFDDNLTSAMSKAAYGFGKIKGTWYTITDNVDTVGCGTLAELTNMSNSGWLIANHTSGHVELTTQNLAEQTAAIQTARDQLITWGFNNGAYHLAFPGGVYDADTISAMKNLGIRTGRTTTVGAVPNRYTTPGRNVQSKLPNLATVLMCVDTTTLANIQTVVSRAVGSNSYCILLIHDIKDTPSGTAEMATSVFNDAIDWIVSEGIDTPTLDEFYRWCL